MNKKILIMILSVFTTLFLIQGCYIDSSMLSQSELEQQCAEMGIVDYEFQDDDGQWYSCYTSNGLIWIVSMIDEPVDVDDEPVDEAEGGIGDDIGSVDDCAECVVIAMELAEMLNDIQDIDNTLEEVYKNLQFNGWHEGDMSMSTADLLVMKEEVEWLDDTLEEYNVQRIDAAAALAAIEGYYVEVQILEEGALELTTMALGEAQANVDNVLMYIVDAELATRWQPFRANEITDMIVVSTENTDGDALSTGTFVWDDPGDGGALERMAFISATGMFFDSEGAMATTGDVYIGGTEYYVAHEETEMPFTWAGYNNDVVVLTYVDDETFGPDTITVYLPTENVEALADPTTHFMAYMITVDGSTFYVDRDGIAADTTPLPGKAVDLARAAE